MSTREFNVSGFTRINIHWALEVEIIRSSSFAVSVTGTETHVKNISVTVEGDNLTVGYELSLTSIFVAPFSHIFVRISLPDLRELSISGAARAKVTGFSSPNDFALYLSGASHIDFSDMSVGNMKWDLSGASRIDGHLKAAGSFDLHTSGASRVELKGSATSLDVNASGASIMELGDFFVRDARIRLSGASRGSISLDGKLDVNLDGASHFEFKGNATPGETRISGASTLRKR
jgi:hypothetical protein